MAVWLPVPVVPVHSPDSALLLVYFAFWVLNLDLNLGFQFGLMFDVPNNKPKHDAPSLLHAAYAAGVMAHGPSRSTKHEIREHCQRQVHKPQARRSSSIQAHVPGPGHGCEDDTGGGSVVPWPWSWWW
jgi:hypothetical protein